MQFPKLGGEVGNVGANIFTLLNYELAFLQGPLPFACIKI